MKHKTIALAVFLVGAVAAGGYALYTLGVDRGMKVASIEAGAAPPSMRVKSEANSADQIEPATGKKVLYWHDPMSPGQKFDKPGKSPFMDMELVPVYADESYDGNSVSISARVQQNLGVRTATAQKGVLRAAVEVAGNAAYNERDVAVVQARSSGFVERLYVRAPLDAVRQGQPLADLYVPDWVAAQEEYLSAKRISAQVAGNGVDGLADAARQRMRLAGMSEEQIRRVEASGTVVSRVTLTAPIGGVVADLAAREGMTVSPGTPLFRINGLSTIWVIAEVPENLAAIVRSGNAVQARALALPGVTFQGKVSAILPEVNPVTRTLKARVELANPGNRLVPGMFVTVSLAPAVRSDTLLVPSEAIIQTGKRSVVVVAQDDGRFAPVDVEVGLDSDGRTEIRKGLQEGQKIVVSGQFLVDSEANLKAATARMRDSPASMAPTDDASGPKSHAHVHAHGTAGVDP